MSVRDFKQAQDLCLDSISRFTCYELCDYKTFISYICDVGTTQGQAALKSD